MTESKADRTEFVALEQSLAKGRAEAVFDDMKILFDSTYEQFELKVDRERE